MSVNLWLRRMTFEQERDDSDEAIKNAREVYKEALASAGAHVKEGIKVFLISI